MNEAHQAFSALATGKAEDRDLARELKGAFDAIAPDAFCGIQIPKRLIPKSYISKYRIDNLWKYNFHKSWRLMYTVAGDGENVLALIIEWLPHKEYERRFGY
ncbi:hypothetical protein [Methanoregula sp.]|uniref:hypothetical protein n=1 Tax=Methanoregula sp. TaxID=2052170 RepID=UPI003C74C4FE